MQQEDIIALGITLLFSLVVLATTAFFAVRIILEKRKEKLKEPELFI